MFVLSPKFNRHDIDGILMVRLQLTSLFEWTSKTGVEKPT